MAVSIAMLRRWTKRTKGSFVCLSARRKKQRSADELQIIVNQENELTTFKKKKFLFV